MTIDHIAFIGGGRIARILLGGWARAGALPETVTVYDCDPAVLSRLREDHPGIAIADSPKAAAAAPLVILAVHPPLIGEVLATIRPALGDTTVLLSLAPKLPIAKLGELAGKPERIVRMIPNAPSLVDRGYNPVTFAPGFDERLRLDLLGLFSRLGACPEVPEALLETYAVVTAMGLTFLWPQLYRLLDLAEGSGLSRDQALEGLEQMLLGAVACMRDADLDAAGVQDLIPVKPVAEETQAFIAAAGPKLDGLLAKLRP